MGTVHFAANKVQSICIVMCQFKKIKQYILLCGQKQNMSELNLPANISKCIYAIIRCQTLSRTVKTSFSGRIE